MADRNPDMTLRRASPAMADVTRAGLTLRAEPSLAIGKFQILGSDASAAFARIVGHAAPATRTQIELNGLTFAWLAPDEWLVSGDEAAVTVAIAHLNREGGDDVLALDLSHGRAAMILSGADARLALAAHCPLDLCDEDFPVGAVARSLLGDTGMFLARLPDGKDGPCFRVIVDQTMAAYAVRMLAGAHSFGATS